MNEKYKPLLETENLSTISCTRPWTPTISRPRLGGDEPPSSDSLSTIMSSRQPLVNVLQMCNIAIATLLQLCIRRSEANSNLWRRNGQLTEDGHRHQGVSVVNITRKSTTSLRYLAAKSPSSCWWGAANSRDQTIANNSSKLGKTWRKAVNKSCRHKTKSWQIAISK